MHPRYQENTSRDHGGCVNQRADRRRTFHRVRQPDVQRELSGFADRAAENQQGDKGGSRAEGEKRTTFEATASIIVKEKRAAVDIKPEEAEKKSNVANACSNERFFCSR